METIIGVRGDSIAQGMWDIENGGRTNRLNNYIWNSHLKNDTDYGMVYNLGIDGETSSGLLKRFEVDCEARQPNVIIFAIGAEDCTIVNDNENIISLDMFQKNISILYQMAKKITDKIIFIGPIMCDENKTIPIPRAPEMLQDMKNTTIYNNAIKQFCEQKNILFIDMIKTLDIGDLEDGMHPTAQGHEKMYIVIRDFLIDKKIISN